MTENQKNIGAYTRKVPIHTLIGDFHKPLAMVALVHARGARKYKCYSWLNDPNASNSSVIENIDAMGRHLGSHTMGIPVDVEGLPHIFHLCCRAGMLVTTFYRQFNNNKEQLSDIRSLLPPQSIGHFITDEEILSLSKTDLYTLPTEFADLLTFIRAKLIEAIFTQSAYTEGFDIFTSPTVYDEIFIAAMQVGKIFAIKRNGRSLVNDNLMTEEDIAFLNHWFA